MFNEQDIVYAGHQSNDEDKRLFVQFSFEPRLDRAASLEAGSNKYKDVEFITIRIPGDKTTSIHRPVSPADRQRFPQQYAAFKNASGEQLVGTPLSLWPGCRPSQAKELEYFNVRTVEQLAAMPDGVGGAQMMGINALRISAKQFVDARKQEAPLIRVQEELKSRDATIEALQDQIKQQGATLDKLIANMAEAPAKKGK